MKASTFSTNVIVVGLGVVFSMEKAEEPSDIGFGIALSKGCQSCNRNRACLQQHQAIVEGIASPIFYMSLLSLYLLAQLCDCSISNQCILF